MMFIANGKPKENGSGSVRITKNKYYCGAFVQTQWTSWRHQKTCTVLRYPFFAAVIQFTRLHVVLGGLGVTCTPRDPRFGVQTRLRSMDFIRK